MQEPEKTIKCNICDDNMEFAFTRQVIRKYDAHYHHCPSCHYMCVSNPHWLEEAYNNPITFADTGIIKRNIGFSKKVAVLCYYIFGKDAQYLDYSGGYGIFTRIMRDIGFDFYWLDPYTDNLVSRGFEYTETNNIKALTSFECFEHLDNPIFEIEKMLKISKNIIFSTNLTKQNIPDPDEWWYYAFDHGQHISFYSKITLEKIAEKFGLFFYSYKGIHMLLESPIPEKKLHRLIRWSEKRYFICRTGLYHYVKRNMVSRTVDDMNKFVTS